MAEIHDKIAHATKWSTITEIAAKLVQPVTTMVLARLLTPEAFGVMVTAVMVISFAEIFTDAGFQKYIIQHNFKTRQDLFTSTNVAFWSNLVMSLVIWLGIIFFCQDIATLVGAPGRGDVIAFSCFCIPLAAFSSIQMAIYRRDFDYKTLFIVRVVGIFLPIFITIPIAWITKSYWALIIGMIALQLSNAIILTIKSPWKPKISYSWGLFKKMFAFSMWSMLEQLSIWATGYCDIFIVSRILDQYYLGLYRTSMTTVSHIIGIISAATISVLFSALSRVQDDDESFKQVLFKFQKLASFFLMPLGVGIFLFRDLITEIMLGEKWMVTSWFIGIWGLTSTITVLFSHYISEALRSKGRPRLSTFSQLIHLLFLIPVVWWGVHQSYDILCDARALVRLTLVATSLGFAYFFMGISPWKSLVNIRISFFCSILMGVIGYILIKLNSNIWLQFIYIIICISIYFGLICMFKKERLELLQIKKYLKK